ncbi:hypothetical protein F5Y17DRAFT_438125 [Xylariaceae sp. FL0594]|nr:hypothetical protein F5Y17DRAFT_438125 [Xylariaceae sp. FL0594]
MPAVKQQRRAAAGSKAKASQQQHTSTISSFARVSKAATANTTAKKDLVTSTPKKAEVKLEALTPASRKRKVVATTEEDDSSSADERPTPPTTAIKRTAAASSQPQSSPVKRGRGRPPKKARVEPTPTPRKRARSPSPSPSDSDASAIDAGVFFKKLRLESSPSRCSSPFTTDTSLAGSDVESDAKQLKKYSKSHSDKLPDEVLSLIDLHAAFLKTLTLHYVHNGAHVPADLRVLCPNVARAWGKKKITDADIRICLGVLASSSPALENGDSLNQLSLFNYGRGKICIESNGIGNGGSPAFRPVDENKLNNIFRANITALWTGFSANGSMDAAAFLATLPKAPVTLCESVAKARPVLLKGQQRLEDLKHGMAMKKAEKEASKVSITTSSSPLSTTTTTTTSTTTKDTPMANTDAPKMSLLDRIRLKSLQKASALPTGLTPAQLERRAALQRAEEVSSLIGMLSRSTSDGRISFPMATLLEKLKDSFRMGISKPEGAACVRLLAAEVAPEWIRVVNLAGRAGEMVVVEVSCQLGKPEVARRVAALLAKEG